jgi:gluconokinase
MIIILIGPSSSGKTRVGRELAHALGWPFIEGDDFHPPENVQRMKAGIPLGDAERAPWLARLAQVIAERAQAGTSAVFTCSALKRAYRAALLTPATPPHAVRIVYLSASPALLAERLAQRRGHFFPPSLLASQLADLEPPGDNEPAPVVSVDAAPPPDEIVKRIVDELSLTRVDA